MTQKPKNVEQKKAFADGVILSGKLLAVRFTKTKYLAYVDLNGDIVKAWSGTDCKRKHFTAGETVFIEATDSNGTITWNLANL